VKKILIFLIIQVLFLISVKMSKSTSKTYKFDTLFLKRFFQLHNSFFPRLCSSNSGIFVLLLVSSGLEQFLAYETGLLSGMFFKVLGDKDLDSFRTAVLKSVMIIMAMVTTKSVRMYTTKMLTVGWRKELCLAIHKLYLTRISFYRLVLLDSKDLDNPDQRMTADCSSLTSVYGRIIADLVVVPFTTAYYTYQAYARAGWLGPTAMFIFFFISTLINKLLMAPVVNLTATLEQKEGDYRYKHMEIRSHAESLAFTKSVTTELEKVNIKLEDVCKVQQRLYNRNFPIDFSVNLFSYLGAIASYLVISVPIFSGHYDEYEAADLARVISETAFVCIYLVFQLGQLVNITSTVAGLAGSTHRVAELLEKLKQYKEEDENRVTDVLVVDDVSSKLLVLEENNSYEDENLAASDCTEFYRLSNVSICAPGSDTNLVVDMGICLNQNTNLLIMGPSGCGKSSLLRVLGGLWDHTGHIWRNSNTTVSFLPQTPFFTNGCLREQLMYPAVTQEDTDMALLELVKMCDLSGLVDRCGGLGGLEVSNWYTELSPGEQQRVAWVRLLYHKPSLAFLDEATSAVSEDLECIMYKGASERNISFVSVGHRGSLRQFHHKLLIMGNNGRWNLRDMDRYESMESLAGEHN